jgi:hypothetical protein
MKKKTALEISDEIGFEFSKASAENYIKYLETENKILKQGIQKFIDKNFVGGSKCDREDYAQMVSCKDIWDLRELIIKDTNNS